MPDEYRHEMVTLNKFIKGLKYKTQIDVETRCPSSLDIEKDISRLTKLRY